MTKALTKTSYQNLLSGIRKEIARGITDIQMLIEKQKLLTYWNIGRYIHDYLRTSEKPRGEVSAFFNRLAIDLDINIRTLQQYEQLYSMFDKKDLKDGLNWSHYRYLFPLKDKQERRKWMARALKNEWNGRDLKMNLMLKHDPSSNNDKPLKLNEPKRGVLYTYRLIPAPEGYERDRPWMVDCGFANRIDVPETNATLNNKWLYTSVKTGEGYQLKTANDITVDQLYTYKAQVLRVIDADTLLVLIDEGFSLWTQQRVRLKGIDAPEVSTMSGRRAKEWVNKRLNGLKFIIIRTSKSDKYDRYLADIFYLKREKDPQKVVEEGIYLNQQLLDQGLAQVWEG